MEDAKFVEGIIKAIVANPNDVRIDRIVDERGVLLTVNVNPTDIGYVIGKKGQNVNAIRTLAKIVGAKNNARVNLKVMEPEGSRRSMEQREPREEVSADMVDDLKI